jgi:hypothetical protein
MGWGKERSEGSRSISQYRYCENKYNPNIRELSFYDNANPPANGSSHTYRCELDKSTGKWTYYDGTTYVTSLQGPQTSDNDWINNTGNSFRLTGEIHNFEDDMPGTASNPCDFSSCQYKTESGGYTGIGIAAADVKSDNNTEWTAKWISATEFQIWDNSPN